MFYLLVYINLVLVPLVFVPSLALPFEIPKIIVFRSLTLLMLLTYIFELMKSKKIVFFDVFKGRSFKKLLIGFLLVLVVGVAFSIAPMTSFWGSYFRQQGAISWIYYFLFWGLICLKFHKKEQWEKAFKYLYSGLLLVLIFGINQKFSFFFDELNLDLAERSLGRISSSLGHPSYLAAYILLIIFPLLSAYMVAKQKKYLVLFFLALLILGLSGSRAGVLGMLVGCLAYGLLYVRYLKKGNVIKVLATVFVLVILAGTVAGRLNPTDANLRSVKSRLIIWPAALEMISKRSLVGYGIETFPLSFPAYADPKLLSLERPDLTFDRAHNNVLDILSQVGIIGLLYYLALLFWICKKFFTKINKKDEEDKKKMIGLMSGFLAFFTANLLGFPVTVHMVIGAFLLAYLFYLFSDKSAQKQIKIFDSGFSRRLVGVLVVLFVFGSLIFQNLLVGIADYKANAGFKAMKNADINEVLKNFSEATLLWPNQSFYNYILAEALLQGKELALASHYTELGGQFSSFRDSYYFLLKAKIFGAKGEMAAADRAFIKAYKLAPSYPPIMLNWGIMYIDNGDCKAGVNKLQDYLALIPGDWRNPETESYRLFYKHNPSFNEVFDYLKQCEISN